MRFSAGCPGEERQDLRVTADVKRDKALGQDAGKWEKRLYPKRALAGVKSKIAEARKYHDAVTLPFDNGVGILPAALIMEYGDRMRQFKGEVENLVNAEFLADPEQWVQWAKKEHNGTFEPQHYPGCHLDASGQIVFDADLFRSAMRKKFYVRTEPLPIPNAEHFTATVASLLGTDLESVDLRVRDAAIEGQREVFRRLLEPVKHMAEVLSKDSPRIFKTMLGSIREICKLAPKLNLAGDAELDRLIAEVESLTRYSDEVLKDSSVTRDEARKAAEALVKKLSGYTI